MHLNEKLIKDTKRHLYQQVQCVHIVAVLSLLWISIVGFFVLMVHLQQYCLLPRKLTCTIRLSKQSQLRREMKKKTWSPEYQRIMIRFIYTLKMYIFLKMFKCEIICPISVSILFCVVYWCTECVAPYKSSSSIRPFIEVDCISHCRIYI